MFHNLLLLSKRMHNIDPFEIVNTILLHPSYDNNIGR